MKTTVYLRIAKGGKKGFKVEASTAPNSTPIIQKGGYQQADVYLPTVSFGVDFDLDEKLFKQAETIVASINVALKDGVISNELIVPKGVVIKSTKKAKK